jgi:hypothetical protein
MNQNQLDVIAWWYGRRDYQTGIALLSKYSKNKVIVHTLNKPGKERFINNVHKLHYEVTKAVHLDWKKMPKDTTPDIPLKETVPAEPAPGQTLPQVKKELPGETIEETEDFEQYPKVIRRLLYESSNLYKKRSMLHNDMKQVDASNTEKNNELRSGFLADIKEISAKLEYYFPFIDNYKKTGFVPEADTVWPEEIPAAPEEPKTLEELRKIKWSLHRENTKDRNKLLYQQRTKAEKENPMPAGPKREAVQLRLKLREEKLAGIINQIIALENAG